MQQSLFLPCVHLSFSIGVQTETYRLHSLSPGSHLPPHCPLLIDIRSFILGMVSKAQKTKGSSVSHLVLHSLLESNIIEHFPKEYKKEMDV